MSEPIISVEGLGKKYILGANREQYVALRDVLARQFSGLFRRRVAAGPPPEEFWALQDVSFDVQPGEVVGIIGRNGAGKSTLLKILSRITEPTRGRVTIAGRVASLLEVGTGFHPELTGRENIYLNGAILGMTRLEIKKKFDEIVAFAEVERFLDTPVKRYSSGMYVRLAFAVAAHLEPEILIIDEVLAVGDAAFQKKCLGKMSAVAGEGRTVLFVSHNIAAILELTSRCVYLERGSIRYLGKTRDAVGAYAQVGFDSDLRYEAVNPPQTTPCILSVEVETSMPGNIHVNGAPLSISVEVRTPFPISRACLSIQVFDAEQNNYVNLWTYDNPLPGGDSVSLYRFKCRVPGLRLYMGNYRLRVFLTEPPGGRVFEILEGVCPFEVVMKDNSRTFQWWPKESAYIEDYDWELKQMG